MTLAFLAPDLPWKVTTILDFFKISLLKGVTRGHKVLGSLIPSSLFVWLVPSCRSSYQFYGHKYVVQKPDHSKVCNSCISWQKSVSCSNLANCSAPYLEKNLLKWSGFLVHHELNRDPSPLTTFSVFNGGFLGMPKSSPGLYWVTESLDCKLLG